MNEKNNTELKAHIRLPYRSEYSEVAASFAYTTAKAFGADDKALFKARRIAEESFVFALGEGVHQYDDQFKLTMSAQEDGILFECYYRGLPLTLRDSFALSCNQLDEDSALDTISLTLLRGITNGISFENCGKNGWKILLKQNCKLHQEKRFEEKKATDVDETHITTAFATPEDAYDIAIVTYQTYGTSYSDSEFYVPELIAKHIENRDVFLSLTKLDNHIIAIAGLVPISQYLSSFDYYMSPPDCRKIKGILYATSFLQDNLDKIAPDSLFYSDCVTSHVKSQALKKHDVGTMISFSVYDMPIYYGFGRDNNMRESLIFKIASLNHAHHWKLFVTGEHAELLNKIITRINGSAEINAYSLKPEETPECCDITERNEFESDPRTLYLRLHSPGQDFDKALRQCINNSVKKGILTIILAIKLNQNLPATLSQSLHRVGFFFTGFMPTTDHQWEMVYQYMVPHGFDFDKLRIFSPEDKLLMEYILKDKGIADNTI